MRVLDVPFVDVTANATLGLQLAYRVLFPRGATVVTTPFTFVATTTSLVWEGFRPMFADIDPQTFNLDPASVAERLEEGAGGLVPVHTFGNPAGSLELARLARRHGVAVVFDAAHAFGVQVPGPSLFARGDASVLSFHATKNFHTFEGGAVATARRTVARRLGPLRNFGLDGHDATPRAPGINAKLSEAQAAMGLVNLAHVGRWIRERRRRYELYDRLLEGVAGVQGQRIAPCRYNYIYRPVLLPSRRARDRAFRDLVRAGVHPRRYFFPPTHRLPFVERRQWDRCPNAVAVSDRVLCLPLYPDLPLSEVRRVARILRGSLR